MEVFTLIIAIIIVYLIYLLIDTISTLRNEVKEMKDKCIKTNKKEVFTENKTKDIKTDIVEKYTFFTNLFKKMI
jgi:predicted Holliday junction resolvase-like endonuclease|tara:strand:+ start:411 stop:632 length:222 start_codon:yes stop_codon:yes gene_type:complete